MTGKNQDLKVGIQAYEGSKITIPSIPDLSGSKEILNCGQSFEVIMERMKTLLGVNEWCHGEYECTTCQRIWHSCRAWKNYGQECKGCHSNVVPSKLEQLFPYCCTSCGCQWKDKMKESSKCKKCGSIAKMFMFMADRRKYMEAHNLRHNNEEDQLHNHEKELCEHCQALPWKDCMIRCDPSVNKEIPAQQQIRKKKKIAPKIPSSPGIRTGELSPHSFPSSCGEKRQGFSYATVTKIYEPPNWTLPSSDECQSSPDDQGKYSSGASSGNPDTSFDSGDFYKPCQILPSHSDEEIPTSKPPQTWNFQQESLKAKHDYFYNQNTITSEIYQRNKSIHHVSEIRGFSSPSENRARSEYSSNDSRGVQSGGVMDYCSVM
ncbi:unnamed protein product [Allacma fusca]|uniref:Zinc finger domain-containing protein n=1 Tax=Allacma fusca TaxID=39272 RepID=A0A8J2KKQ6_9HEXA|nr:unnamed protein product [Allacma fusca]